VAESVLSTVQKSVVGCADDLKDIGYPISDKISELCSTHAVQLPECNYLHLYRKHCLYHSLSQTSSSV